MRKTKQIEVDGKKYDGISAFIIETMPQVKRDSQQWKNLWVKYTRRALNPKHEKVRFTGISVTFVPKKKFIETEESVSGEVTIPLKICTKCKDEKTFSEFHKDKSAKSGYASQCKVCKNKKGKK